MKLALWQTHPRYGIDPALDAVTTAARTAADAGVEVLVTPEMFVGGYNIGASQVMTHADQAVRVQEHLAAIARRHGIALVAGLALPGSPHPLNACIAIDRTGQEVGRYNKTHLFGDVDRAQFTAGDTLSPVFDLAGWKVALAICYDIEFPELARALTLRGADCILCPTANMAPFDGVATRLVPARAEENAIFVAYCNYVGAEGEFAYNGLSCVTGPDGADLVRGGQGEELLYAMLDRETLRATRATQTHLKDRRPDLYGGPE
ncbi:carbon-nitrogen hydrolase family protein [Pseudaestuariivita atlantica]|uniref:Hydrolase n=1 Tax=Pseudaestuariivita atlantica TaxID=1317121 RepID=A0A0L1JS49_9RHOB|nr:carbon-nitrogen hydrolase family protein [Pseudaestuariivita atlantica]KNG94619.1 hydrolase [Pseudaestuariivita atlantica]